MEKIKSTIKNCLESEKGKDILIVIIVILVGLGSFELGRLSKENGSSGIKILPAQAGEHSSQNSGQDTNLAPPDNSAPATTVSVSTGKNFFASSRGSKYYSLGCSGGKTIKQENRVYFATGEEAQAAGYTLSSSCN
jgi:hypothetical protein